MTHDRQESLISTNFPVPITSSISQLYPSVIKISATPHMWGDSTSILLDKFAIPHLASSICRMLELQDDGTLARQWEYCTDQLPMAFRFLDVWTYFQIRNPAIGDFYEDEKMSVYCRADRSCSTSVLVEINSATNANAIQHMSFDYYAYMIHC